MLNLMRAPNSPPTKAPTGLPTAQIVVYVYLETLLGLAKGAGWSVHGLEIPVGDLRRRLCTEGVIPIVLGGQSEILDVGREIRLAPDYMKRAVLARDGGCLYPGCTVPPEHCEFHHIKPWKDGGGTSVDWQIPEWTAHHHMIDNGELSVVVHDGLPHLILPSYLDPEQIPRRNTYWQGPRPTLF
ncbi:HNH endonuclease signature motif containing protein [Paeniglutamicibacter kerguelensis]|uniref:HNH endonuclease signature motif containing protein n=2 Tax=Paeniglutamicibacter kerguelensis TaxID=254788 RepID=UPI00361739E0